ncbi:MAG TPA: hypothetical protein VGN72_18190 [Tepidisphaeraceae bacterium]|nr:hypothetical protein [Tepidisphaeraceae bacterium]
MSTADAILQYTRDLGYAVLGHRLTGSPSPQLLPDAYTEMHAVRLADRANSISRASMRRVKKRTTAVRAKLAGMVGIDLEG